jgi:CHC2 zinc finger
VEGIFMSSAAILFEKHLDLKPLRGRFRGVVRCIFHPDRTASLSIDMDRGIFNCFGCGERGGLRRFAALVGETTPTRRQTVAAPESPLQEARRWAARQARLEGQRAAEWEPWYVCADFIRRSRRTVDQAHAVATTLGPEHPRVWGLLSLAARAEAEAHAVEMELDEILASGRVA